MSTLYIPDSMGWGNVILCLTDLVYHTNGRKIGFPRVYKSLLDVERGVKFNGIKITDDPNELKFDFKIVINQGYLKHVHSLCKDIIEPTDELAAMIEKYAHGATHGIHIRRGAYSKDSENMGCHGFNEDGTIKPAYFANDGAIKKFMDVVESKDEKFFLASDSKEIKELFKSKYPDKIITLDNDMALTYQCVFLNNKDSREARLSCYLDWFLLSKCKELYITAGNEDLSDLSTFGYTAGVYGDSNIHLIFNEK